ncbi:hypothetical protein DFA_07198 [Cavenderia fasciculata]|uniref:ASPIC/UnbV domain-containing protein n=1 Tax=Cavenderia fasciculata TaxID=261658 RepID=F4PVR7_CACFS|nr:uncharacterized protein DFA_07198 [Cavenderia fasciculata]EGG20081.1 hypothetical protein DFA_07198 [Cavenderia fasciculata]|eukprot:XP_004367064.1 hypothetical protein DFA_07198 [Cavenderia fasciculata]
MNSPDQPQHEDYIKLKTLIFQPPFEKIKSVGLEWDLLSASKEVESMRQQLEIAQDTVRDYQLYARTLDHRFVSMGGDELKWGCDAIDHNTLQDGDHAVEDMSRNGAPLTIPIETLKRIHENNIRGTTDIPPPQCKSSPLDALPQKKPTIKLMCSKFQFNYMDRFQFGSIPSPRDMIASNSNNSNNTTPATTSKGSFIGSIFKFNTYEYIIFEEVFLDEKNVAPSFGSAWGDFNDDGLPDLYVNNHYWAPALYINQGDGSFKDMSRDVFPSAQQLRFLDKHGSAWADFDKDGQLDLFETTGAMYGTASIPNNLYRNDKQILTDEAEARGVDYPFGRGRTISWLDYNMDGHLDAFIATQKRSDGKGRSMLFRQNGNTKTFAPVTNAFDIDSNTLYARMIDIDNDGRLELFILSFSFPFKVYHVPDDDSESDPKPFKDVTTRFFHLNQTAISEYAQKIYAQPNNEDENDEEGEEEEQVKPKKLQSTGWLPPPPETGFYSVIADTVFGDLDNNGYQDVILSRNYYGECIVTVFYNLGKQEGSKQLTNWHIVEIFRESGISCGSLGIGDFDNDLDLDIILLTYYTYSNAPNVFFVNHYENIDMDKNPPSPDNNYHRGVFGIRRDGMGAAGSTFGRAESISIADYDLDGRLDIFITNGKGSPPFDIGPNQLFHNVLPYNRNWIQINVIGKSDNPHGFGGRIIIKACSNRLERDIDNGVHFSAQNSFRVHFGLGGCKYIQELTIWWPALNKIQTFTNLKSNQIFTIKESLFK